jgi:cytoskeleton protein RodZ
MMESENAGLRADPTAPGVALRAARIAQNLGVGDVARQLRLSVAQIEALESGAFERLPGPVFARGFIRNYARYLKLDAELLLRSSALVQASGQGSPVPAPARGEPMPAVRAARWPWYVAVIVVLVFALAAYELLLSEAPSQVNVTRSPPPVTVPISLAPLPAQPQTPEGAAAGSAAAAPSEPVAADAPAAAHVAVPAEPVSVPPTSGESELRLSFDGDSWVEIRDGRGKTILSQVHRRGTEQRVHGQPPLVVVVGNARAVRLTYNDHEVDLEQYIKRDVARLTLE